MNYALCSSGSQNDVCPLLLRTGPQRFGRREKRSGQVQLVRDDAKRSGRLKGSGAVDAEYLVPSEHSTVALRTANVLGTVNMEAPSIGGRWRPAPSVGKLILSPRDALNISRVLLRSY
eukprot:6424749-Prymnesium_polylepis.1